MTFYPTPFCLFILPGTKNLPGRESGFQSGLKTSREGKSGFQSGLKTCREGKSGFGPGSGVGIGILAGTKNVPGRAIGTGNRDFPTGAGS
jgi:hypothetical protein